MASALTQAHIAAEARLRGAAVNAIDYLWASLPAYNRENVDEWLAKVIPVALAAQRQSVTLTEAYLARAMGRAPLGLSPAALIDEVRPGVSPETQWERPFVTLWTALGNGTPYDDALGSALARAQEMIRFDVQGAMRATAGAVNAADEGMYGFERVADAGACAFCQEVDGAYVKSGDAMALHNGCGCGLEPLTEPHSLAATLPSGVAVHQHGEMGLMLGSPDHDFTGPSDI